MQEKYQEIWSLALPYLKKGVRKDFVIHTKGVVRAMGYLLEKEKGDEDVLLPAAILHDVGWAKVPKELQKSNNDDDQYQALKLHIKYAPEIIKEILTKLNFKQERIKEIIEIVIAHKFQDPEDFNKRLLIDADTLSDAFKEQFYNDVKAYNSTPQRTYEFRKKNTFYTKSAKELFDKELEERKKEIT
jgi:HD superfamily phosphodiesterase